MEFWQQPTMLVMQKRGILHTWDIDDSDLQTWKNWQKTLKYM